MNERVAAVAAALLLAAISAARADILQRESDITALRLGQKVYIDDGSCPSGQIKEISGVRLTPAGVERARKCVERRNKR